MTCFLKLSILTVFYSRLTLSAFSNLEMSWPISVRSILKIEKCFYEALFLGLLPPKAHPKCNIFTSTQSRQLRKNFSTESFLGISVTFCVMCSVVHKDRDLLALWMTRPYIELNFCLQLNVLLLSGTPSRLWAKLMIQIRTSRFHWFLKNKTWETFVVNLDSLNFFNLRRSIFFLCSTSLLLVFFST